MKTATKDHSIDSFEQLFEQVKVYLRLQKEFTLIKLSSKLAVLFSQLVLGVVYLILGVAALFFLFMALAYLLAPVVGGMAASFAIIGAIDVLIICIIASNRKKWIIRPTVNFLAHLLLDDEEEVKEAEDEK